MKLVSKERIGAKVKKQYDVPQTPYQRLLALEEISAERKTRLRDRLDLLHPFALKRTIDKLQKRLHKMTFEKNKGRTVHDINRLKPFHA